MVNIEPVYLNTHSSTQKFSAWKSPIPELRGLTSLNQIGPTNSFHTKQNYQTVPCVVPKKVKIYDVVSISATAEVNSQPKQLPLVNAGVIIRYNYTSHEIYEAHLQICGSFTRSVVVLTIIYTPLQPEDW